MSSDNASKHLAHDLNNIFTRILSSIELLKRKVPASQEIIPLLNTIEAGTYLASEMIGENLNKTSLSKNKRRINLNSIISDVVRSYSSQQKEKIIFDLKLDPDLKLVMGRYSDFYRVILNLVVNAIESISGTGIISFYTANITNETQVEIIIIDTGSGISKENLPLIFEENFSTKAKKTDSGIGLSIVKKIIGDNNGDITVASEQGKGTEFRIVIESAPALDPQISDAGKTILIAEDEDILRELLAELLESYNYTVLSCSTGLEALEMLKVRQPDLVIIDKNMPEMGGFEFLNELSISNKDLPVIFASGSPLDEMEKERLVARRIIQKPYNFEELLSLVRDLIG
ncbi:MAG: hypothetical protein CVV24_12370 [Ignavibacteriae bacterium HGW-Ignavibacteriae-3]|nr:MAG: hypothetical protein CVV24_12370 [Ignavibacteriae bacterium HGW-Ignavibacteriae-3]